MKIKQTVFAFCLASILGLVGTQVPAFAQASCGGEKTAIISCSQTGQTSNIKDSGAWGLLLIALNILTATVGIAAVGGIVYAAILYSSATDNASQTKDALEMIRNIVIGLVAYGLMYIGLNFLIPGGIFQ